jgi:diguanylate cyclase (GGDEF)-like protein
MPLRYEKRPLTDRAREKPLLATAAVSLLVVAIATTISVFEYELIGQYNNSHLHAALVAAAVSAVLAPAFLYPLFRLSARLEIAQREAQRLAMTDRTTGLPNFVGLSRALSTFIRRQKKGSNVALHLIDIRNFRQVNESASYEVGNHLLRTIGERLREKLGEEAVICRLGGDDFAVLQEGVFDQQQAECFATRLREIVSSSYNIDGQEFQVRAVTGTSLAPLQAATTSRSIALAELALAAAARSSSSEVFKPDMRIAAERRRAIENGMTSALENDQFSLAYQPIYLASSPDRMACCEALIRWPAGLEPFSRPDEFIPLAEESGLIVELGKWVLRAACRECKSWQSGIPVAVNVSPAQFVAMDFPALVNDVLDETGLPSERLQIEVTETALIEDVDHLFAALTTLRKRGVTIAIDDFGSGHCGLNYVLNLPIDKIKIDKELIQRAVQDEKARNVLRGISRIAREAGIIVVAEGVDTERKQEMLLGDQVVDELQGFLYSSPVEASNVHSLLSA